MVFEKEPFFHLRSDGFVPKCFNYETFTNQKTPKRPKKTKKETTTTTKKKKKKKEKAKKVGYYIYRGLFITGSNIIEIISLLAVCDRAIWRKCSLFPGALDISW